MSKHLSADAQAAHLAEQIMKGGAAGDLPENRGGDDGAEGGFTTTAGGRVIDDREDSMSKAGKTGAAMTGEPGRQGEMPRTGSRITNEPDDEDGSPQPGEPGLDQTADDGTRARKPGQVGVSGGSTGGGMDEDDDSFRARKPGQAGITKGKAGDDDDMGGDEDEDEDMEMSKGGISASDLIKSLDALEGVAAGSMVATPEARRRELASKLANDDLTKSELRELHSLTAGPSSSTLRKSLGDEPELEGIELPGDDQHFAKSMAGDSDLREGFEVSEFLEKQTMLLAGHLDTLSKGMRNTLEAGQQHQARFNSALAKSLRGMAKLSSSQGALIKSLTDRLSEVENTPLGRRSVMTGREAVLSKSMVGEVGQGVQPQFTRSQLMDGLEDMAKSMDRVGGIPIQQAMALLESTGEIPKSALQEVLRFRQGSQGVVRVGN